jgi:hypothetical protein
MPVGTWHRDMGPIHYTVAIKDGHLTLTCTMSEEGVSINHTLTADCYLTRNGSELVGLITSFDISFEGKPVALDDITSMAEGLPKVQKELAEKPFALSFRMYDDTLVIGNVRLPSAKEDSDITGIFGLMAGRYKQSQGRPPAPRAVWAVPACNSPQCVPVQIQPVEWEVPQAWPQQVPPLPPAPYPQRIR